LMTFPAIRRFGASLLASAGVAGLIVGLAARETISSLLAGIQVALTEPIRLDDVVIVEGEWGRIEEIRMTYVVVRIWDERRLVVPLSYFIEKPFQNWTRKTANILGTVFLYVDYAVPVDEVREQLHRILKDSGLWDGKVWNLQVTDATERTMQLRALMSAPDSSTAWDLRCDVREKLIEFLQREYPGSLPVTRAELGPGGARAPKGGDDRPEDDSRHG
jgi:small-conductance mechanosensitive channel